MRREKVEQWNGKIRSFTKIVNHLNDLKISRYTWDKRIDETGYAIPHDTLEEEIEIPKNTNASASDLIKTAIDDYGKFTVEVMKETGLTQDVYNDMIKPQSPAAKYESFG